MKELFPEQDDQPCEVATLTESQKAKACDKEEVFPFCKGLGNVNKGIFFLRKRENKKQREKGAGLSRRGRGQGKWELSVAQGTCADRPRQSWSSSRQGLPSACHTVRSVSPRRTRHVSPARSLPAPPPPPPPRDPAWPAARPPPGPLGAPWPPRARVARGNGRRARGLFYRLLNAVWLCAEQPEAVQKAVDGRACAAPAGVQRAFRQGRGFHK
ncbi:uncharacterized protein [Equus przewalskii]|uniref:Uncharacterized protein n=1 Tax=Equus przewalskii TaxID=9798 RepID=A0ABM4MA82_EQUPR